MMAKKKAKTKRTRLAREGGRLFRECAALVPLMPKSAINLRGNWPQEQINITGQSADERMNWTLADVGHLFPTPRIELPPLVSSNK